MSEKTNTAKLKVAVFFGGRSAEHDVSILSALQVIEAMDITKYEAIPVYVDQTGHWWTGEKLLDRRNYPFTVDECRRDLRQVRLTVGMNNPNNAAQFEVVPPRAAMFQKTRYMDFDIAFPMFHGTLGEDGCFQGLMEMTGIPYVGCRVAAAAITMSKSKTKKILKYADIPVLDEVIIEKPRRRDGSDGFVDVKKMTEHLQLPYPICVKPCNLGSSIGVHKVHNIEELHAAILDIFRMDYQVLIEPFVQNLVEYNVAATRAFGEAIRISAIERPMTAGGGEQGAVLNFKDKYLSQGGLDSKLSTPVTEGMASQTRVLNPPELTSEQISHIHDYTAKAMMATGCHGAPRMDFLCDGQTGQIWLNEINTIPGSLGYFLWEAGMPKIKFTELLTALIDEGIALSRDSQARMIDPSATRAKIFGT